MCYKYQWLTCKLKQYKIPFSRAFSHLGTLASLLGVIYTLRPEGGLTSWHIRWVIVAIVLFIIAIILDYISAKRKHVFMKYDDNWKVKARKYMYKWIKRTDRVAIFSRDLSWVDDEIKALLEEKAFNGELIICAPKHTDNGLTKSLQEKKATVLTYDSLGYDEPQSRFTIAGYGKGGASIAIAHSPKDYHMIEEYSEGHPAFFMAKDLIEILKRMNATND